MNRIRIFKGGLLIVVCAVLIGAVVIAQGTPLSSSAAAHDVTRQPRPHPKSHIKIDESSSMPRYPRPHPASHIRSTATSAATDQP